MCLSLPRKIDLEWQLSCRAEFHDSLGGLSGAGLLTPPEGLTDASDNRAASCAGVPS